MVEVCVAGRQEVVSGMDDEMDLEAWLGVLSQPIPAVWRQRDGDR